MDRKLTGASSERHHLCRNSSQDATSFTIQHRAPGDTEFVLVAEDVAPSSFDLTGMPAGLNAFIVTGVNSRGEGEPGGITTVEVLLAAA